MHDAQKLTNALVIETATGGREALRSAAESALETLAGGPLVRQVALQLRKVDDAFQFPPPPLKWLDRFRVHLSVGQPF